jgi:hypothetical protein
LNALSLPIDPLLAANFFHVDLVGIMVISMPLPVLGFVLNAYPHSLMILLPIVKMEMIMKFLMLPH